MILNIYTPNTGILSFIKQTRLDIKPQINASTVVAYGFNILLSQLAVLLKNT